MENYQSSENEKFEIESNLKMCNLQLDLSVHLKMQLCFHIEHLTRVNLTLSS